MELLLVRHAESEGNVRGVMQGRVDFPLSPQGLQQSACLARHLKEHYREAPPDFFLASPLKRAWETAEVIAETLQIPTPEADAQLVEVSSGIFSGLTWPEALERYPEDCSRFKQARDWGVVPEGESREVLWQRARDFLKALSAQKPAKAQGLVVTHGGFIRALLGVVAAVPPSENLFICIDNTSLSLIGLEGDRRYIRFVNRTQHLDPCDFQPDYLPK